MHSKKLGGIGMKILQSEKDKLLKWVNNGQSVYFLHNYLVNVCGYHQLDAQDIIYNIDNIEVFDEGNNEYNLYTDGKNWFIEEYTNNELTFAAMGNNIEHCYSQIF